MVQDKAGGITTIPLHFDASESLFIVFRKSAEQSVSVTNFTRDGRPVFEEGAAKIQREGNGELSIVASEPGRYEATMSDGKILRAEIKSVRAPQSIIGPWTIAFPPHWGAPEKITLTNLISWSDSPNDGVKYFSGTAIYRTTFDYPRSALGGGELPTFLDLGDVQVMARVKLNGHDLGILWKTPFRVEVTQALREGGNELDIQVANLWPNRMIGDASLPETKRFTWSSWQPFRVNDALLKSGMLGPVTLNSITKQILR